MLRWMSSRGLLLVAVAVCIACDTAQPEQTQATSSSAGQSNPNGGTGGSGGDGPGIDLGISGNGGVIGGLAGTSSGSAQGGSMSSGGSNPNAGASGAGSTAELPRFVHYISGATYSHLVIEVDSVDGLEPHATMADRIPARFAEILDKEGIDFVLDDRLEGRGSDFVWTNDELDAITTDSFDGDPDPNTVAIHVTYLDGHSESDSDSGVILGVAWGHLQIVMFKQTIEESCAGLGLIGSLRDQACEEAEFGILSHEIGHVLGLVDNGLPMQGDHVDPEHPAHDVSQDCIMYWAYEGQGLVDLVGTRLLANDEPLSFCQHCLDDLNAAK